jgi:hypothetical protein
VVDITQDEKGNTAESAMTTQPSTQVQPCDHVSKETLERITSAAIKAQRRFLDNLLEMSRKYGDFRQYARITGDVPEDAKKVEDVAVSGPILSPGKYTATIDIPDLSKAKEGTDKISVLQDVIEKGVIYNVIERNLADNNSPLHHQFFKMILNVTPDGAMQESKELEVSRKPALQQTIDQCVNAVLEGVLSSDPKVVRGARVSVSYSIDSEGRMTVESTKRKYFDPHEHKFSIPVKKLRDDDFFHEAFPNSDDARRVILRNAMQKTAEKVIAGNLRATNHPECHKFIAYDSNGIAHLNNRGREYFSEISDNIMRQLVKELAVFPKIEEGGLVRAKCIIEESGVVKDVKLDYTTLDPDYPVAMRELLPDTKDMTEDAVDESVAIDAIAYALNMLKGNMAASQHPHLKRYFETRESEEDGESIEQEGLAPEGVAQLGGLYRDVLEVVTDGMLSLDERRPVPFYLSMNVGEPEQDGDQTVSLGKVKKAYLDPKTPGKFRVDVAAQPKRELGDADLRGTADSAVHAAVMRVVGPHMASTKHPLLDYCFEMSAGENPHRYLNERGANELEDVITSLAERFSVALLQLRARVPDHFSGYRALLSYAVKHDDSLKNLDASEEKPAPSVQIEYVMTK